MTSTQAVSNVSIAPFKSRYKTKASHAAQSAIGLVKRAVFVTAAGMAFVAQAELKPIGDTDMAEVTGQSGLVIEAGFGSIAGVDASAGDFYGVDWSGAGVTIDAFKWILDIEGGWDQDSNRGVNERFFLQAILPDAYAGVIAKDIAFAGAVDVTIDATADLSNVVANGGAVAEGDGGIGVTFANSDINMKVGDMGIFVEEYTILGGILLNVQEQQSSSFGGVEVLGMNIDGLELVVRGTGQ